MFLGIKDERAFNVCINKVKIKNSNKVKLLGIKIDSFFLKVSLVNFAKEHHANLIPCIELGNF